MSVPSAATQAITPVPDPAYEIIKNRIMTPYNADAFERALNTAGLSSRYPDLPHKLRHGFPLGNLEPLTETYAPSNHVSVNDHVDDILQYFNSEIALQRMSGPFTSSEIENILGRPFRSSPIQVAVVPGELGKPDKKRICHNLSFKGAPGLSVNDSLNSDDFPTRWGTAHEMAEIVSTQIYLPPLVPFRSGCFVRFRKTACCFSSHYLPSIYAPEYAMIGTTCAQSSTVYSFPSFHLRVKCPHIISS